MSSVAQTSSGHVGLTMANTPRPAADGMDSEVLRQQDMKNASQQPRHLRIAPPSGNRHRNLNMSPSSTSYSKVSSATYIPYEPVKGAVKAVTQSPTVPGALRPGVNNTRSSPNKDPALYKPAIRFSPNKAELNSSESANIGLSENRVTFDHMIKPQMSVAQAVGSKTSDSDLSYNTQLLKSIQVPVYNAPNLNTETYQKFDNPEKDKYLGDKPGSQGTSVPKLQDDHIVLDMSQPKSVLMSSGDVISNNTDSRSVEGQVTSPTDTLRKEIDNLRDQLKSQTKVNGELKKLLVASMGDDLHYRVECLVRTNAQLASEMGLYSNKISQDGENMDQLGIQADLWRSKYHASRVQVDELLAQKSGVVQKYEESCSAIEELLQERYQLRDSLFSTYRVLQQLCDAFEPLPPSNRPASFSPKSVTDIAARNYKLANNMKFRLLGTIQLYPALYGMATPNVMTAAEQHGIQILSEKAEVADNEDQISSAPQQQARHQDVKFSRYNPHPYAKYDNITFVCCGKCTGEIKIV